MIRLGRTHALALFAIIVVAIGIAGHLWSNFSNIAPSSAAHAAKIILDSLLQTLQLFTLGARPDPGADNWALVLARLGGAFVAFSALGKIMLVVLAKTRQRARVKALRGHLVLCGYGERGRLFARSIGARTRSVAVDPLPADDTAEPVGVLRVQGDARDPQVLRQTNLSRADRVVIGTGSDDRNLGIARTVLGQLQALPSEPLALVITVDDPALADAIEREDGIMRPQGLPRPVSVTLFNPGRAAALALLAQPHWARRALALGQSRIVLAVLGSSDVAIDVILQFLRISPCAGLAAPHIHWVAPAATRARLLARTPNLVHAVMAAGDAPQAIAAAPLAWAVRIVHHDLDPESAAITEVVAALATAGPLTALVVACSSSVGNIQLARNARREMQRRAQPACPIHVHTPVRTSLDPLLRRSAAAAPSLADVPLADSAEDCIEPFGRLDDLCTLHATAHAREQLAQALHQHYLQRRHAERTVASARDDSLVEWPQLKETYRRANRRAADHLPVKQLAARHLSGLDLDGDGFPAELTPALLEQLAAIEHDSWRIDRELDGWRYGEQRDNARLLHPDLVAYSELPEGTKEYDRAQVRELSRCVVVSTTASNNP